jgi:hypothetical protein
MFGIIIISMRRSVEPKNNASLLFQCRTEHGLGTFACLDETIPVVGNHCHVLFFDIDIKDRP